MFGRGIQLFGPFWGHVLGYWNAHLKNPQKVLFLKYEDLKENTTLNIKKIAEFIGSPFSLEEEEQGVIKQISEFCSFENLRNLEVNKIGKFLGEIENSSFFRKGEVGDSKNYLTPVMAERIEKIIESKLEGSGLTFENYYHIVPALEFDAYRDQESPDLEHIPSPRILSIHISYNTLPDSIRESECKIIYICRNPLDLFISLWHFLLDNKMEKYVEQISIDEAFDMFCRGNHYSGVFSFILSFRMEKVENLQCSSGEVEDPKDEFQELLQTLEQKTSWSGTQLVKYNGFWFPVRAFKPVLSVQKYFKAKDSDIILCTLPKSGTTWLKALTFCIVNRHIYTIDQSPLLTSNPHTVVPFLEINLYWEQENPNLEHIRTPRIFGTHLPFSFLLQSIHESECKAIYICRNPLDQFVSFWHFMSKNEREKDGDPLAIDEAFDMFCHGINQFGPFWDHVLEYWNARLNNSQKVLFLKYEDLKEDVTLYIKKIAEFIGYPFSLEEEKQGLIQQIANLCSFSNLSNLDTNKKGKIIGMFDNSTYFRKGEVGDWANYLTPAMGERIEKLMENKLEGSGLVFKTKLATSYEENL
ncbi:hypothetical protein BUALT_Bualt05G0022700 [Buddleja alternifolia]|uniref:Sulfotransferase n=1 Tax=Buddleja alternifolia TaxID=168488 RepID=A0AAV6XHG9_9LAMI|nr:hypothetical protein BUALT_Bualt05G0022700 [Buddleja alternifolia]